VCPRRAGSEAWRRCRPEPAQRHIRRWHSAVSWPRRRILQFDWASPIGRSRRARGLSSTEVAASCCGNSQVTSTVPARMHRYLYLPVRVRAVNGVECRRPRHKHAAVREQREWHQQTRAAFLPHFGFDQAADSPPECARRSRARLVLRCDAGCSNRECARRLKVTPQTAGKWRARFSRARHAGIGGSTAIGRGVTGAPGTELCHVARFADGKYLQ
jgi:hypothetical protein